MEWSKLWQLPFNESKCKSIHVGPRNPGHRYTMQGNSIKTATEEKDLGVSLDLNQEFCKQAATAASKGNQMLALLRRSFLSLGRITLPLFYKTLAMPHLEYGNLIWGPFNRADQQLIERVQRRSTKLVPDLRHLPYKNRSATWSYHLSTTAGDEVT